MKRLKVIRPKGPINFISLTEFSYFKYEIISSKRRRTRLCRLPKQEGVAEGGEYP